MMDSYIELEATPLAAALGINSANLPGLDLDDSPALQQLVTLLSEKLQWWAALAAHRRHRLLRATTGSGA